MFPMLVCFAEADVDENQLMGEWFNLVHEKNALVRYESELMVRWVMCSPITCLGSSTSS